MFDSTHAYDHQSRGSTAGAIAMLNILAPWNS
ncbi:UNVERIFIED_ORG: hypothetical protein GGE64_002670 [Rhizobium etli]